MRATRIDTVQALRAFAALSVAVWHVLHDAIPLDPSGHIERWHNALPWASGVDLFFVISGFVMVYASAELFGRRSSPMTFMARRLIRIVPLYWGATTLFLVVALATPSSVSQAGFGLADVVMSYAFLPTSRPDGTIQPIYSLGWTLNYEMFFYVVFAACIVLPRRRALAAVALLLMLSAGSAFAATMATAMPSRNSSSMPSVQNISAVACGGTRRWMAMAALSSRATDAKARRRGNTTQAANTT